MHNNQAPTFTVSKVGTDKSIPLVENILVGDVPWGFSMTLVVSSA